jgi:hypothetical protein
MVFEVEGGVATTFDMAQLSEPVGTLPEFPTTQLLVTGAVAVPPSVSVAVAVYNVAEPSAVKLVLIPLLP